MIRLSVEAPTRDTEAASPPGAARWRAGVTAGVTGALVSAGVTLWAYSLNSIALDRMTDVGLASALPASTWVGIGLVTAGCAFAWQTRTPYIIVGSLLAMILVLHGLGVLGEPTMRFVVAWQHVGIADYIASHGSVDPRIDAYFNWPGFFVLSAFLSDVAGLKDVEPIARAAPLFYNAMYFVPLVVIGRALFDDARVVWLGVWLFFVNNWIGQDYYSPQGFAFFLYLVVVAVLLRWFKGRPPTRSATALRASGLARRVAGLREAWSGRAAVVADAPSRPAQRVVLLVVVLVIALTVVASHQLTPFVLIAGSAALAVVGACRLRTLPLIILLMTLLWTSYMAATFLTGHIHDVTGDVGAVNSSLNRSVGGRVHGSPGHELIVRLRLAATALLWLTAVAGLVRRARRGYATPAVVALALAPFPLLSLQAYGGEIVLRIALFAMPFMAFLAASFFVPATKAPMSVRASALLAGFATLSVALFPFTRYGNERMDYFSPGEVAGVRALYRLAPEGSVLVASSAVLPWRYTRYADYDYKSLSGVNLDDDPRTLVRAVVARMSPPPGRSSFLIITRSMKAQSDLFGPWRRGAQDHLQRVLTSSSPLRVVYRTPDATVFSLRQAGAGRS